MRFAITPAKAKSLAEQFSLIAPALTSQLRLDTIARIAGFKDWQELEEAGGERHSGPELPMQVELFELMMVDFGDDGPDGLVRLFQQADASLAHADAAGRGGELRNFASQVLGANAWATQADDRLCPPMAGDYADRIHQLQHVLVASGLVTLVGDGASHPLRLSPAATHLPPGTGVFYEVLRTDALDSDWHDGIVDNYEGGVVYEVPLPADSDKLAIILADEKVGAQRREAVLSAARTAGIPAVQVDEDVALYEYTRLYVAAPRRWATAKGGALCVTCRIEAGRNTNTARVYVRLSGWWVPGNPEILSKLANAASIALNTELSHLTWAMLGASTSRLDLHIEIDTSAGVSGDMRDLGYRTMCLLGDESFASGKWKPPGHAIGLHMYVGERLPQPPEHFHASVTAEAV